MSELEAPVLRGGRLVLFPGMRCEVHVGTKRAENALAAALTDEARHVFVFAARVEGPPGMAELGLHDVGALAHVLGHGRAACGHMTAELEGLGRVRTVAWGETQSTARCVLAEDRRPSANAYALARAVSEVIARIHANFARCGHVRAARAHAERASLPEHVLGAAVGLLGDLPTRQRQALLELDSIEERLEETLGELHERLARHSPVRTGAC